MITRKTALLLPLAALIIGVFLSVSRAPALNEKAMMGTRTDVSAIAFDTVMTVSEEDPGYLGVIKNTVNWSYTNWKGMTFGILFGATILTLLQSLPLWSWRPGRMVAALQGVIGGAPLGVCVNCATPIAQGLHRAGLRLETTLATMMSSPSLNFIVVTMMLALFQSYFVTIKILTTLFFVTLAVPLVVRLSGFRQVTDIEVPTPSVVASASGSWFETLQATTGELAENLWFIVRISVPLMLLAGFLGAALIETISFGELSALPESPWTYLAVGLFGALLPVPIAFDVVITAALMSAGLPAGLAMTLFFSLSIFSIFPALVIARDISVKVSILVILAVTVTAAVAGLITSQVHDLILSEREKQIDAGLVELGEEPGRLPARLSVAKRLCAEAMPGSPDCLEELIRQEALGFVDAMLCSEMAVTDAVAAGVCGNILVTRENSRSAIATGDPGLCMGSTCLQNYINARADAEDSFDLCGSLLPAGEAPLCRLQLMQHRIRYFRSDTACEGLRTGNERQSCRAEVSAMAALEQMDLEVCLALSERGRSTCVFAYLADQVQEAEGQYDCAMFEPAVYRPTCHELNNSELAWRSGDYRLCDDTAEGFDRICRFNVLTRLVKAEGNTIVVSPGDSIGTKGRAPLAPSVSVSTDFETMEGTEGVRIERVAFRPGSAEGGRFLRREGEGTGLNWSWRIDATDLFEPFGYGKGIAAGDLNGDSYPDLAIAFEKGAYIYQNLGGGRFSLVAELRPGEDFNAFVVSFVDFNNDGWLDLFMTGYGGKRVLYLNEAGYLGGLFDLPSTAAPVTIAAGFADLDRDGDLDMVLGNWAYGVERNFRTHRANNELWFNEGGLIRAEPLFDSEPAGQTLSVLLTDLNGDREIDIVVGNDRQVPDIFYMGTGGGSFAYPPRGMIPETSLNTMSYESADFNNDLKLDLFSTDMRFDQSGRTSYCEAFAGAGLDRCGTLTFLETMIDQHDVNGCLRLQDSARHECLAAVIMTIAIRERRPDLCERLPATLETKKRYCRLMSAGIPQNPDIDLARFPTQFTSNKLLLSMGSYFADITEPVGVTRSNWSWNARAVDLDGDGYQDLLIGNGYGFGAEGRSDFLPDIQIHSNVFYRSEKGVSFSDQTEEAGLTDYTNTPSFAVADVDLDGDIDVITTSQMGGVRLYENRLNGNHNISFELVDWSGNSHCVGCRVVVTTESGSQMRELKLSGGFLSYDEPIAHFGLGGDEIVTGVEIRWSTGGSTRIDLPLSAGYRYRITRDRAD